MLSATSALFLVVRAGVLKQRSSHAQEGGCDGECSEDDRIWSMLVIGSIALR